MVAIPLNIFFNEYFQGLYIEIIGQTLIDLKTRTNSSYESLAVAVSGASIGYFIGAVAGGFLIDKFGLFLDLALAVGLDLGAVGTVAIPWIPNTQLLWILCCLLGASTGIVNTGIHAISRVFLYCLSSRLESGKSSTEVIKLKMYQLYHHKKSGSEMLICRSFQTNIIFSNKFRKSSSKFIMLIAMFR